MALGRTLLLPKTSGCVLFHKILQTYHKTVNTSSVLLTVPQLTAITLVLAVCVCLFLSVHAHACVPPSSFDFLIFSHIRAHIKGRQILQEGR